MIKAPSARRETTMRHCLFLLTALLPLLLSACSTPPGTQVEAEVTEAARATESLGPPGDREDHESRAYPRATASVWAGGFLWTANETGLLTRWGGRAGTYQQGRLPGGP